MPRLWTYKHQKSNCLGPIPHSSHQQSDINTDIVIIPGGLSSIIQPLDVSVNHPFKCKLCELWSARMLSGSFERTAAGNLKQPLLPVITQWVKTARDSNDPAIITKPFKKCSISNDLDGMEDDVLWDEQHDKSYTDSDKEGDKMYDDMMTHEQLQQMFNEDSDADELFWF